MTGRTTIVLLAAACVMWIPATFGAQPPAGKKADSEKAAAGKKEASGGDEAGAPGADKEPEFKNAKGKDAFEKGKEFFGVDRYKEAKPELVKAKEAGKTPADKAIV